MTGPSLDHAARLEANALIDRLVATGSTFSSADARRLIEIVPVTRAAKFSFIGTLMSPGRHLKGEAAGVGDMTMREEKTERRVALKAPPVHRIGGYEVTHAPGEIGIEPDVARDADRPKRAELRAGLRRHTGELQEMLIARHRVLRLFVLRLSYVSYIPWKTPVAG